LIFKLDFFSFLQFVHTFSKYFHNNLANQHSRAGAYRHDCEVVEPEGHQHRDHKSRKGGDDISRCKKRRRKSHCREDGIGDIVQKGFDEGVFDPSPDKRKGYGSDKIGGACKDKKIDEEITRGHY